MTAAIKPAPKPGSESPVSILEDSFIAIVAGATSGLLLMFIIIIIIVRVHVNTRRKRQERANQQNEQQQQQQQQRSHQNLHQLQQHQQQHMHIQQQKGSNSGGSIVDTCSTTTNATHLREAPPSPLDVTPDMDHIMQHSGEIYEALLSGE